MTRLAPIGIVVAVLFVLGAVLSGVRREGRRRATWIKTRGRVLDVRRRTTQSVAGSPDTVFRDYFVVRCTYRTADGRVLDGWSDRQYNSPVGSPGQELPIWYDPTRPDSFSVLEPQSALRAGIGALPAVGIVVAAVIVLAVVLRLRS